MLGHTVRFCINRLIEICPTSQRILNTFINQNDSNLLKVQNTSSQVSPVNPKSHLQKNPFNPSP